MKQQKGLNDHITPLPPREQLRVHQPWPLRSARELGLQGRERPKVHQRAAGSGQERRLCVI